MYFALLISNIITNTIEMANENANHQIIVHL